MKLFNNKKGFELSISTIVIAVLAIIILIIMILIFRGQAGGFTTGLANCESKGGTCTCVAEDAKCSGNNVVQYVSTKDCRSDCIEPTPKAICCIPAVIES